MATLLGLRRCAASARAPPTRLFARALPAGLVPLATRKQVFKEHLWKLRKQDPERWTSRTLAAHFRLPLTNVQAMLALQELEEAAGKIEPDAIQLAADAEEYLDSEYDDPNEAQQPISGGGGDGGAATEEVYFDREAEGALGQVSHEDELALVAAVAQRFGDAAAPAPGVGAGEALGHAMRRAIAGLTIDELRALEEEVSGTSPPTASVHEDEERRRAQRAILGALVEGGGEGDAGAAVPLSAHLLAAAEGADWSALSLPEAAHPRSYAASEGDASSLQGSSVGVDGQGTWRPPEDAFWVDHTAPREEMQQLSDEQHREALEADGLRITRLVGTRSDTRTWRAREKRFGRKPGEAVDIGTATIPEELRLVRSPDFGAKLKFNLEARKNRLSPDGPGSIYIGQTPNKGQMVFTEIARPHKKVPLATRVWVSQKGQGVRPPNESETRMARLRVQPPIMMPRIKRNRGY